MRTSKETTETYTFWLVRIYLTPEVRELEGCRVYTPDSGAQYAVRSLPTHTDYVFERIGLTCFATRKEALAKAIELVKKRLPRANYDDTDKLKVRLRYLEDEYDPVAAVARRKKERLAKQSLEKTPKTVKAAERAARKSSVPLVLEDA